MAFVEFVFSVAALNLASFLLPQGKPHGEHMCKSPTQPFNAVPGTYFATGYIA